jgi:hypothetical protein
MRQKLTMIGAEITNHGRHVMFQMAEVALSRQ